MKAVENAFRMEGEINSTGFCLLRDGVREARPWGVSIAMVAARVDDDGRECSVDGVGARRSGDVWRRENVGVMGVMEFA